MTTPFRVIVVGAGPGGMAAAAVAAECGSQVTLLDENPAPGGQIWRGYNAASAPSSPHSGEFARWSARLKASGAEILPDAAAVDSPGSNVLRVEHGGSWQDVAWDRLIVATGARERFLPFPGWTLPGVTGVGGLQAMVKGGLPIAGKRIVVAGSGPLLLAVAAGLNSAGARIEAIFEQATWFRLALFGSTLIAHPAKLIEGAVYRSKTRSVPYKPGWWVKRALGQSRLESIVATDGVVDREIACDYLACAYHLAPNLELAQLLGCRIDAGYVTVNAVQQTSVSGVFCAGEPTGIGGLDKALLEGEIAALAASGYLGKAAQLLPTRQKLFHFAQQLDAAFAPRKELREMATPDTIVCRCEDVTRAELEGSVTGRAAKLHTRCGMGPCQGRICGPATQFLFGWSAASIRPPIYPARIATVAGVIEVSGERESV
jgi:NADPH-dependent 2,4-dienoyl-CoA reductase/sulfur reductase-like enzyme